MLKHNCCIQEEEKEQNVSSSMEQVKTWLNLFLCTTSPKEITLGIKDLWAIEDKQKDKTVSLVIISTPLLFL